MIAHPQPSAQPVRVLVVDDHPFFREGIRAWIERQDDFVCCGCADSVLTGLETIARLKPDIVLLDLQLRDGDGFAVLETLAHCEYQPRVIVVSHKEDPVFAERSLRAGARGYVLKDEASEMVLTAMREVLDGGIHISTAMRRHLSPAPAPDLSGPMSRVRGLCHRELQVLELLGRGHTTKEAAYDLGLSPKTIEFYRENLKKKLGLPDSLALVRMATLWDYERAGTQPSSSMSGSRVN